MLCKGKLAPCFVRQSISWSFAVFNSQMFDRFSHDNIVKIMILRQTYVNMKMTDIHLILIQFLESAHLQQTAIFWVNKGNPVIVNWRENCRNCSACSLLFSPFHYVMAKIVTTMQLAWRAESCTLYGGSYGHKS